MQVKLVAFFFCQMENNFHGKRHIGGISLGVEGKGIVDAEMLAGIVAMQASASGNGTWGNIETGVLWVMCQQQLLAIPTTKLHNTLNISTFHEFIDNTGFVCRQHAGGTGA